MTYTFPEGLEKIKYGDQEAVRNYSRGLTGNQKFILFVMKKKFFLKSYEKMEECNNSDNTQWSDLAYVVAKTS